MAARARTAQIRGVAKLSSIPARRKTVRAWPARASARSHSAACHRYQRPLARRDREILGRADSLADAGRILQARVAPVEVTAQDARGHLA